MNSNNMSEQKEKKAHYSRGWGKKMQARRKNVNIVHLKRNIQRLQGNDRKEQTGFFIPRQHIFGSRRVTININLVLVAHVLLKLTHTYIHVHIHVCIFIHINIKIY